MNRIKVIQGDITKLEVDAIVNAANTGLMGGGGVDGAIHRAGGPEILEQCLAIRNRQGGCPTGEAVITTGGKLKAKFIIHAVGPIWKEDGEKADELLACAYKNSLILASENEVKKIAFPNISTGVYGFPKQRAANIAVQEVNRFLGNNTYLEEVIFCCFDEENHRIYSELLGL